MAKLGLFLVFCGSALFILPLLGVSLPFLTLQGIFRILASLALIIIGTGLVAFSAPR